MIAPRIGATQKSQSWLSAQPLTKIAGPVLRAGLTEVLVMGMLMRWISVRQRPMAMGAKPLGARSSVAPRMTRRKKAVRSTSADEAGEEGVAAGGVVGVAVGGEAAGEGEAGFAACDDVEDAGGCDGPEDLGDDVGGQLGDGEAPGGDQADGDSGVEMAAGDVADGEGHGEDGEAEGEGHTDEADSQVGEGCCEDGAAATAEDKPEGAEELGCCTFREMHSGGPLFLWFELKIWWRRLGLRTMCDRLTRTPEV